MANKFKKKPKALLLLSGGIDSPVAGYLVKGSVKLKALHFSSSKITGNESIKKCKAICKILGIDELLITDISDELLEIANKCKHAYYFVIMRRLMYRIANEIAKKEKCDFIATGESIGQVSSQTLANLSVISLASNIPIVRPLLCMEKEEIIKIAEDIGTFEISKGPEYCDALGPKHPVTKAHIKNVLVEEEKIDVHKLVCNALKKTKRVLICQNQKVKGKDL
ncbi:MAG: 7-cyano-7-deazaguanine synthase [Candidatus Diapherotrites archaeon]